QRQVHQLGAGEQVRGTARAGRDAGAATDARGMVEGELGGLVVDVQAVGVRSGAGGHGDVTALLHDAVPGGTVDDHVADDRVRGGTHRLDLQRVAVLVLEQALLAGRGVLARAVRTTVDVQATGAANALAAVGCE